MSISNYLAADYSQLAKQAVGLTTEPSLVADKSVLLAERKESKLAALGKRGTGFTEDSGLTAGEEYKSALADALATPDKQSKVDPALRTGALADHLKVSGFDPKQVDTLAATNDISGLRNMYYGNIEAASQQATASTEKTQEPLGFEEYTKAAEYKAVKERYENEDLLDKAKKFVTAIPAGAAKGVVEVADVIQEVGTYPIQAAVRAATGDSKYDIDFLTDDAKKAFQDKVDSAVGYDRATTDYATGEAVKQLKEAGAELSWDGLGKLFTDPKQRDVLLNAMKTGAVNPDIVSGSIAELFGGGGAAGAVVKGTGKVAGAVAGKIDDVTGAISKEAKVANAGEEVVTKDGVLHMPVTPPSATDIVNNIGDVLKLNSTKLREELAAIDKSGLGKAEKAAAIAELEKTYTLGKATTDMIKGSIMTNAYAANLLNNHIQQFKDNNNGEDPTIGKLAEMVVLVKITSGTEVGAVKYALGIKTLTAAEKKEIAKASVAGTIASVTARLGTAGGLELGQEVLENVTEELNTKLDSADYEGKSAQEILQEASAEIIASGAMGAVGGVQMKGAGMAAQPLIDAVINGTGKALDKAASMQQKPAAVTTTAEVAVPESKAKQYANALVELRGAVQENKITADTIGDYIDKVESLYDIRTGIEGFTPEQLKKADDTYKAIASKFNEIIVSNPELKLSKVTTPEILGSAPSLEGRLQAEQIATPTGETNAVLAERVLNIALDAAKPEEVDSNAVKYLRFAVNNGISKDEAIQLVKNYASVEEEATVSDRGYRTYGARAKAILSSANPDTEALTMISGKLESFLNTTTNSRDQLEGLVKKAQQKADELNKIQFKGFGKGVRVTGDYTKLDGQRASLDVTKNSKGVWEVSPTHLTPITKMIEGKNRTIKGIVDTLGSLGSKRTDVPLNVGQLIIPEGSAITQGVATARANYSKTLQRSLKAVEPYVGKVAVNKVIVDENSAEKHWKPGNDYYNANVPLINTGSYSTTDVVTLHGGGKTSKGISNYMLTGNNANPAALELLKAVDAGATIVLDRSFRNQKTTSYKDSSGKSHTNTVGDVSPSTRALTKYLENKGYMVVPGTKDVFVKATEENKKKAEQYKAETDKVEAARKVKEERIDALVDLEALLLAQKEGKVALTEDRLKESKAKRDDLYEIVLKEYFHKGADDTVRSDNDRTTVVDFDDNGNVIATTESVEAKKEEAETLNKLTPEEKLQAHITSRINKEIARRVREYGDSKVANEGDPDLLTYKAVDELGRPTNLKTGASAFALMAKDRAAELVKGSEGVDELLVQWKAVLDKRLPETETNRLVEELIRNSGINKLTDAEGNKLHLGRDILELTYSKGKGTKYIVHTQDGSTKFMDAMPTDEAIVKDGIVRIVEVEQDINKFVTKKADTMLSTLVASVLPASIKLEVQQFHEAAGKVVKPFDGKTGERFGLLDSPARGLLFNSNGTMSPQVTAAMWLAMMETFKTDKYKLALGAKSRADIAKMLNVPESQVTKEQLRFAKENGMLNKSLANTLGKAVLGELGLGKKSSTDVNKGHYELLAADIGNMAIATAASLGWVEYTTPSVAKVSTFYGKEVPAEYGTGNDRSVRFVNIKPMNLDKEKQLKGSLGATYGKYEAVVDKLPTANVGRKEPYTVLTEEQISKNKASVRNDVTGGSHAIPEEAQQTLDNLMRTKYKVDAKAAREFIALVEAPGSKIKELLGYIPVDEKNEAYAKLTYDEKDIQESINRDIDKSIEELKKAVEKTADGSYEVQYLFYYTRNGRYMMDSNTINPQTDKLHRFLVQPAAHTLQYEVVGEGSTTEFTVNGKNVSYSVRLALAQAFGIDIDKSKTSKIKEVGSRLLGLTTEQLEEVKTAMITKGKFGGYGLELEAAHITHTLQGLDFLRQVKTGSVTSALTAEFDSVTNGFMNKLMQLPILGKQPLFGKVQEHLARVGIVADNYLKAAFEGKLGGLIDLATGEAINSMLSKDGAAVGFLDSYKNLASIVAEGLKTEKHPFYTKFKDYLPAPDAEGGVSSELRTLFKAPFMTFNYSASIKNITENLSEDLVNGLLKKIAENKEIDGKNIGREIAALFAEGGFTIGKVNYNNTNKEAAIDALIDAVRNKPIDDIRFAGKEFKDYYVSVVNQIYGTRVKDAFEKEFSNYMELQDTINDAFKITFRQFEVELIKELDKLALSKHKVTDNDYKELISKLWDKFPAIKGPMTKVIEGVNYDVIPVTDSGNMPNDTGVVLRDKAQSLVPGLNPKHKSMVVYAVMKFLKEASKAGSVLPFHYIDGAELGRTVNEMHSSYGNVGFTPIHDAVMAPLTMFDEVTFSYNKNVVSTNEQYVLIDAIADMVNTWDIAAIDEKATATGLNAVEGKKDIPLRAAAQKVKVAVSNAQELVREGRKLVYANKDQFMFNNLVGTPGGYYRDGMTGPDTSYLNGMDYTVVGSQKEVVQEEVISVVPEDLKRAIMASINNLKNNGCN